MAMNIYYTAKDIEELAARGVSQLEVGPNVFLTDFAYETAEQLEIELIRLDVQKAPSPASERTTTPRSVPGRRYNKPSGCQHGSNKQASAAFVSAKSNSQDSIPQGQSNDGSVNRLVDIMSKIMKRGD
jgi:hypothetical protein